MDSAAALSLVGCSATALPTHSEIQAEADRVGGEIIAAIPNPVDAPKRPDTVPLPCEGGELFTGNWDVHLPEGSDVAAIMTALPSQPSLSWMSKATVETERSSSYLALVRASDKLVVNMIGTPGKKDVPTILVTVISACGQSPAK